MNAMTTTTSVSVEHPPPVSVISDPGAAGWPDPPKLTKAESLLYGDMAATVRLLGQAAAASEDAYALACKTSGEWEGFATDDDRDTFTKIVMEAWYAHERVLVAYRDVTARAVAHRQRIAAKNGEPQDSVPLHPPGE